MTDTGSTTAAKPRRWKKRYFVILGVLAIAACGTLLVTSVFTLTRPVVVGGDAFMGALKEGNFERAYSLSTPALQRELGSAEELAKMAGPVRPTEWSWSHRSIRNGVGEVEGGVTFTGGEQGTARLVLHQVGGEWRVAAFQLNPP